MTDTFRALCAELIEGLDTATDHDDLAIRAGDVIARARALLAQPVAEGPTDEEIHDFIALWWEDFGKGYLPCSSDEPLVKAALARFGGRPTPQPVTEGPSVSDVTELFYRHMGEGSEVGFENAIAEALSRWGRPAAAPVPEPEPGEVEELVAALGSRDRWTQLTDAQVDRAATLLQQLSALAIAAELEALP